MPKSPEGPDKGDQEEGGSSEAEPRHQFDYPMLTRYWKTNPELWESESSGVLRDFRRYSKEEAEGEAREMQNMIESGEARDHAEAHAIASKRFVKDLLEEGNGWHAIGVATASDILIDAEFIQSAVSGVKRELERAAREQDIPQQERLQTELLSIQEWWKRKSQRESGREIPLENDNSDFEKSERFQEMVREKILIVPPDVTWGDLLRLLDKVERSVAGTSEPTIDDPIHFIAEAVHNFDSEIEAGISDLRGLVDKEVSLLSENEKEALNQSVRNWFQERGVGREEVEAFLPIEFR